MKNTMASESGNDWVILFAAFMTKFLGPSLSYIAGVYHMALVEQYEDVGLVAWLGSLFACMFALTGPLGSFVINSFDCRTCVVASGILGMIGFGASFFIQDIKLLFLSYGLIAGLGAGLAQSGCMVIIGYYFPNKSSLVSGITTCGSGLGIFINPILIRYLLDNYGLRGAFLLTGGFTLNLCVCGMLMRPSSFETERKKIVRRSSSSFRTTASAFCQICIQFPQILQNVSFALFAFTTFTFSTSISTLYLYLPDYFHTKGASLFYSSLAISASGIGSIISRIFGGLAANDKNIGPDIFYACLPSLIGTITLFLSLFSASTFGRIAYGFLTGLYSGAIYVMYNPIVIEILGVEHFSSGLGIVSLCCGVGLLVGPPIAGAILQSSGNYYHVFLFSAVLFFLTTVTAFCCTLVRKPSTRADSHHDKQKQTIQTGSDEEEPLASYHRTTDICKYKIEIDSKC